jgi:hypothetical protein
MEESVAPIPEGPQRPRRERCRFQFRVRTVLLIVVAVGIEMSYFVVLNNIKPQRQKKLEPDPFEEEMRREAEARRARETAIDHLAAAERWGTLRRQAAARRLAAERLAGLGGEVKYHEEKPEPQWLRDLVGEEPIRTPISVDFSERTVPNAAWDDLEVLSDLRGLYLGGSDIADGALEHIKGLAQLRVLHLHRTRVTDAGLVHLQGLTQLQALTLSETGITDAGLVHLTGLSRLKYIDLPQTVTDSGKARLTRALPGVKINLSQERP